MDKFSGFNSDSLTMSSKSQQLTDTELLTIISLSKTAIAVYTTEDIIVQWANDTMISSWKKQKSVIGKPLIEGLPELAGQPFIKILQDVWRTGNTYEAKDIPANIEVDDKLQTFYFDFEYRAFKNNDGSTYCILHTSTDVTERMAAKRAVEEGEDRLQTINEELTASNEELTAMNEELSEAQNDTQLLITKLAASETKFRSLVGQIPTAINVFNGHELVIELPNEKMLEIWGRTLDEVIDKPMLTAMPELAGQPFIQKLYDVLSTGKAYYSNDEKAFINRNGELVECYFNIVYQPLINEDKSVTSVLQIANEVTEDILAKTQIQNLNEELASANEELAASNEEMLQIQDNLLSTNSQLTESEERFRTMAESVNVLIAVGDESSNATYFNQAWTKITGRSTEELLAFGWVDLLHPDDKERYVNIYLSAFEKRIPFKGEFRLLDKDGTYRWFLAQGPPRFRANGTFAGYISSSVEISEQKKDEQRKNDFIGMVSHELKTPLTSMSGYLQILEDRAKKNEDHFTAGTAEKANKQVRKMTSMINGFLNVSRLESGKIHIDKTRFDMALLAKEAEEETHAMFTSHKFVFHPVETTYVNADRDKISHVINNLISNAVKYSQLGSEINIACLTVDSVAKFSVKDCGIGIKGEDIPRLFERYYRIEDNNTKSVSGFGIGLYLCAEIIHRHNGKIWAESEVGNGSNFYFTLPLADK